MGFRRTTNIRLFSGFTLIELLIVIAIILILIAIALPNFLEAQVRAKIARVKAELRTVSTAVEAYQAEIGSYPLTLSDHDQVMNMGGMMRMSFVPTSLTTPIQYLAELPLDVFNPRVMMGHRHTFLYINEGNTVPDEIRKFQLRVLGFAGSSNHAPSYGLLSTGPDNEYGSMQMLMNPGPPPQYKMMFPPDRSQLQFSPTNGTKSHGDIVHFGP